MDPIHGSSPGKSRDSCLDRYFQNYIWGSCVDCSLQSFICVDIVTMGKLRCKYSKSERNDLRGCILVVFPTMERVFKSGHYSTLRTSR